MYCSCKKRLWFPALLIALALFCTPDNNPQTPKLPALILTTRSDSTVAIRDSFYIFITTDNDAGIPLSYCLARDDSWTIDTVAAPGFSVAWDVADTGMRQCVVWAFDSTGRKSNDDTISVRVYGHYPEATLQKDTSVFANEPLLLTCDATDGDDGIVRYEWSIDGVVKRLTDRDRNTLLWSWEIADTGCHTVSVVVVDTDGLSSDTATQQVCIVATSPKLLLTGDTTVSVNDTARFVCSPGTITTTISDYQWSTDPKGSSWLTTPTDTLALVWRLPDTGFQTIRCRIIDTNGITSAPESLIVYVSAQPPLIVLDGPAHAIIDDSTSFSVSTSDEDGTVARLLWHISSPESTFTTLPDDSTITMLWSIDDTGYSTISVTAIDNDSLRSITAVRTIRIAASGQFLLPLNDTTLIVSDTLVFRRTLADTSLTAQRYYVDTDTTPGWDDSSSTLPACTLFYTGSTPVRLVTGILTDNNILLTDTTLVHFNLPPVIDTCSLVNKDTVWCAANALPGGFSVTVTAADPDDDSLHTTIIWGRDSSFDTLSCEDTCTLPVADVGWYEWTVIAEDSREQSSIQSGTTCIGREYTICFAGHSIVAGFINDATNPSTQGGFRAGVLANLRDSLSAYERIRPVGPYTTGMMYNNPDDDSCFAVSGSIAREMYKLLEQAYPKLTADIWVLMFGVNSNFDRPETISTLAFIRSIFTRNSNAQLYVLTSPPYWYNLSFGRYNRYNDTLRDTVANWAANGYHGHIVEADSVLSDGYTIYDSLFAGDEVHPNQAGYDAIRNEIIEVMWNREPPVLDIKHEDGQ